MDVAQRYEKLSIYEATLKFLSNGQQGTTPPVTEVLLYGSFILF